MVVDSNRNDLRRFQGRSIGTECQDKQWNRGPSEGTHHPARQAMLSAQKSNRSLVQISRQSASSNLVAHIVSFPENVGIEKLERVTEKRR